MSIFSASDGAIETSISTVGLLSETVLARMLSCLLAKAMLDENSPSPDIRIEAYE